MTAPRKAGPAATKPSTHKADAELARLRTLEQAGVLTPDAVVADAADPASPLHNRFNWDNDDAARQYRLQQARELIVRFRIDVRTTERTVSALVYMRDPRAKSNEQGMVSIERVLSDRDLAMEVVVQEVSRALDLLRRAGTQAEALGLGDLIGPLIADATGLRDRLSAAGGGEGVPT